VEFFVFKEVRAMATNRKLQAEIDRTLKKVEEGLDLFNEIWDKVYAAQNLAQRDKFEADLKSQIKKLQRLRDQIKVWQADPSIKDKSKIDVARKKIEEKMEAFKVCERETKTKAFSKEGLAQDRADPLEKSKNEVREWVRDCIEKLKVQIEEREADIEASVSSAKKKKIDHMAVDALRAKIARHQYHIEMLERILRALDNDAADCDDVNEIRDSVEYYVEANTEDGFLEDEGIYDALTLEVPVEIQVSHIPKPKEDTEHAPESKPSEAENAERKESEAKRKSEDDGRRPRDSSTPGAAGVAQTPVEDSRRKNSDVSESKRPPSEQENNKAAASKEDLSIGGALGSDGGASGGPGRPRSTAGPVTSAWANQQQPVTVLLSKQSAAPQTPTPTDPSTLLGSFGLQSTPQMPTSVQRLPPGRDTHANALATVMASKVDNADRGSLESNSRTSAGATVATAATPFRSPYPSKSGDQMNSRTCAPEGSAVSTNVSSLAAGLGASVPLAQQFVHLQGSRGDAFATAATASMAPEDSGRDASERSGLEAALLAGDAALVDSDPIASRTLLTALRQLEEGALYLTAPSANGTNPRIGASRQNKSAAAPLQREQVRYEPRNPFPVHGSFPQSPLAALDSPELYERLDPDTLFFIFFFPQNPRHQLFAALELKRHAWRFHKRYLTWFQRHEEPRFTTDDYESGSYVYFDHQMWCQRVRQDFLFSYADLEDELPVV